MRRPRNGKREVSIFYALTRTVPAPLQFVEYSLRAIYTGAKG